VFELVLRPGSGKAAPQLQRDFTQRFEALEGAARTVGVSNRRSRCSG